MSPSYVEGGGETQSLICWLKDFWDFYKIMIFLFILSLLSFCLSNIQKFLRLIIIKNKHCQTYILQRNFILLIIKTVQLWILYFLFHVECTLYMCLVRIFKNSLFSQNLGMHSLTLIHNFLKSLDMHIYIIIQQYKLSPLLHLYH